jgi:hypothetical protein
MGATPKAHDLQSVSQGTSRIAIKDPEKTKRLSNISRFFLHPSSCPWRSLRYNTKQ